MRQILLLVAAVLLRKKIQPLPSCCHLVPVNKLYLVASSNSSHLKDRSAEYCAKVRSNATAVDHFIAFLIQPLLWKKMHLIDTPKPRLAQN
tara:strand:- start:181 stop:453 length:273 start_codon:yes stop_codon:yes gene_type:complete